MVGHHIIIAMQILGFILILRNRSSFGFLSDSFGMLPDM